MIECGPGLMTGATFFLCLYNMDIDFRFAHSLSAISRPSVRACGVSLGALFPQEFQSTSLQQFERRSRRAGLGQLFQENI